MCFPSATRISWVHYPKCRNTLQAYKFHRHSELGRLIYLFATCLKLCGNTWGIIVLLVVYFFMFCFYAFPSLRNSRKLYENTTENTCWNLLVSLFFKKNPVGCVTTRTQGSIFHVKRCNDIPWPWWRGQSPTKAILSAPVVDKSRTTKGRWKRVAVPCMKSVLMRSCPRTMSCDKKAMGVVNAVPQTRQKNYRWQIAW